MTLTGDDIGHADGAAFKQQLAGSQLLRAWALALLFGLVVAWLVGVRAVTGAIPLAVPIIMAAAAAWEAGLALYVRARVQADDTAPNALWYVSAFIEVAALTAAVAVSRDMFDEPVYALSTPPVLGYCIIIVSSALRLELRFSLFTGALAAISYLVLALATLPSVDSLATTPSLLASPPLYVGKALALALVGVCAGLVGRELRRSLVRALEARRESDRTADASQLKSLFLANVSHELRTPLNAIMGQAQLLSTDSTLDKNQRESISTINTSAEHLLSLVDDVIELSRSEFEGESASLAAFDLDGLLSEVSTSASLACQGKGIAWTSALGTPFGMRTGDGRRLRQVLDNLIGNAVKFTGHGSVTMSVDAAGDQAVRFAVTDSGPGIAPGSREAIFLPFLQDEAGHRHGGSGLGLAIASRYVALMGGNIEVTSAVNEGATFAFTLPLPPAVGSADQEAEARAVGVRSDRAIKALVVDDLADNRAVLRGLLSRTGVDVEEAGSGEEALAVTASSTYDVVFMDISMPRVSGTRAALELKARGDSHCPVLIAVSASVLPDQRESIMSHGFDAFVGKPVRQHDLYMTLATALSLEVRTERQVEAVAQPLPPIELPTPLRNELLRAATSHNMTLLRRCLDELSGLDGDTPRLVERLRPLVRTYDFAGVQQLVEETSRD